MNPIESIRAAITASRALCAAATPGPWTGDCLDGSVKYQIVGPGEEDLVMECDHKNGDSGFTGENAEADEAFVLASRQALPAHVDALELAVAALEEMKRFTERDCEFERINEALAKIAERLKASQ